MTSGWLPPLSLFTPQCCYRHTTQIATMPLNVLVLGLTGAGKSTLCTLLSEGTTKDAGSGGALSQTTQLRMLPVAIAGQEYTLVDTVGLMDTSLTREQMLDELERVLVSIKTEGYVQVRLTLVRP